MIFQWQTFENISLHSNILFGYVHINQYFTIHLNIQRNNLLNKTAFPFENQAEVINRLGIVQFTKKKERKKKLLVEPQYKSDLNADAQKTSMGGSNQIELTWRLLSLSYHLPRVITGSTRLTNGMRVKVRILSAFPEPPPTMAVSLSSSSSITSITLQPKPKTIYGLGTVNFGGYSVNSHGVSLRRSAVVVSAITGASGVHKTAFSSLFLLFEFQYYLQDCVHYSDRN